MIHLFKSTSSVPITLDKTQPKYKFIVVQCVYMWLFILYCYKNSADVGMVPCQCTLDYFGCHNSSENLPSLLFVKFATEKKNTYHCTDNNHQRTFGWNVDTVFIEKKMLQSLYYYHLVNWPTVNSITLNNFDRYVTGMYSSLLNKFIFRFSNMIFHFHIVLIKNMVKFSASMLGSRYKTPIILAWFVLILFVILKCKWHTRNTTTLLI